jgi:hypothetical protein
MDTDMDVLEEELERVHENTRMKRELLLMRGVRAQHARKLINLVSGFLAILSAGAITAVLTKLVGSTGMQIFAAISAAISGTASLLVATLFDERETTVILEGASDYLYLREKVVTELTRPNITPARKHSALKKLLVEYAALDEKYAKYLHRSAFTAAETLPESSSLRLRRSLAAPRGTGSSFPRRSRPD